MAAGRTRRITCLLPAGWNLEQARQNLTVHSLADVKPSGTTFSDRLQHILIGMKPGNLLRQIFVRFM